MKPKPYLFTAALITWAVLSGPASCYAQDAQNPVPVSKEPRHHNVFENSWVRVLDVHINPGDTSFFHKHETPSVFIVLNNVKSGSEVIIEEKRTHAQVTFGNIWFESFYTRPRIHRVWNEDTSEFHVMDVELVNRSTRPSPEGKNPIDRPIDPPIKDSAFQLLFDETPVRGYLLNMQPRTHFSLQERLSPVLVVQLTDAPGSGDDPSGNNPSVGDPGTTIRVNGKPFRKKGDFLFIPSKKKIEFNNNSATAGKLAFFELK